jgi:hypothetical protein
MNDKTKVFCCSCKQKTFHSIVFENSSPIDEDEKILRYRQTIECCGCSTTSIVQFEVNLDDEAREKFNKKVIPETADWHFELKKRIISRVPINLKMAYEELISNYNSGNAISCSGMVRTIIEGLGTVEGIKEDFIKNGKKPHNINYVLVTEELFKKGFVTKKTEEILSNLRFLGNDALHSLEAPSREELKLAIHIVENLLENVYVIQHDYNELMSKRQERKTEQEKSKRR